MSGAPRAECFGHRRSKASLAQAGEESPGSHRVDLRRRKREKLWTEEQDIRDQSPVSQVYLSIFLIKKWTTFNNNSIVSRRSRWNRVFSLSLFVEHMLLGIEELEEKLKPLVLEQTRKLGKVCLRSFL